MEKVNIEKIVCTAHIEPVEIEKIKGAIKKLDSIIPIVVDDEFNILSGDGVFKALQELGYKMVPVEIIHGLTARQKKLYKIGGRYENRKH